MVESDGDVLLSLDGVHFFRYLPAGNLDSAFALDPSIPILNITGPQVQSEDGQVLIAYEPTNGGRNFQNSTIPRAPTGFCRRYL